MVVAVHVVGRDVHDHCDVGAEAVHVVKLEAGELDDVVVVVLGGHLQGQRLAHVAGQSHVEAARLEDVVGHHRGGGLAVRAGDADHLCIGVTPGKLDLRDDGGALLHQPDHERGGEGHAGALDHLVGIEDELLGVGMPVLIGYLVLLEQRLVLVLDGRHVAQEHVEPLYFGQDGGTCAALSCAYDGYSFHCFIILL